jgi:pescadillo protein
LEYVILAFGGTVDLENNHAGITHVITDRDNITKERTKEYIQPQWIYDSVNFNTLLNVKEYQVGKVLFYLFRLFLLTFLLLLMKTILRDMSQREKRSSEAFSKRKLKMRRRTLLSRMTINMILLLKTRRRLPKRRRNKRTILKFQRIS